MGIFYYDEEYLKVVGYLINEKEWEVERLRDKIERIAERSARTVKSIQLGPVVIDPSMRRREVPEILWNMRAAEEYLESNNLKNSLSDVVNGILNQEISDFDILSIACDKGIKAWGTTYDRNGDRRYVFRDASLLYYYEPEDILYLNDICIRAK